MALAGITDLFALLLKALNSQADEKVPFAGRLQGPSAEVRAHGLGGYHGGANGRHPGAGGQRRHAGHDWGGRPWHAATHLLLPLVHTQVALVLVLAVAALRLLLVGDRFLTRFTLSLCNFGAMQDSVRG